MSAKMLAKSLLFLSITIMGLQSIESAKALVVDNQLGRQIDFDKAEKLLLLPPNKLISAIQKDGVRILLNKSNAKKINPIFKGLKIAKKNDMQKVGYYKAYPEGEAEFLSAKSPINESKIDTIIIADNAETITLIHEYMHYLSHKQLSPELQELSVVKTWEAGRSKDRMETRFHKIMRNSYYLENKQWRTDMLTAIDEYTLDLPYGILYAMSEEIVIERALKKMIPEGSAYYDQERIDNGQKYAEVTRANIMVRIKDIKFLSSWIIDEILALEDLVDEEEKANAIAKRKEIEERAINITQMYINLENVLK